MIQLSLPRDPEPGVVVRLTGTCGHTIDVRLTASAEDVAAVGAALDAGEKHALLDRFCPFCLETRPFPFSTDGAARPEPRSEPSKESWTALSSDPMASVRPERVEILTPAGAAYRLWDRARALLESDPEGARPLLRNAASLFEEAGRIREYDGVQADLARLTESADAARP